MFTNLSIDQNLSDELLNNALKELYATNYFESIKISNNAGTIEIIVKENPIIQQIIIQGVKDKNIKENLEKITKKLEKYPFIENNINDQILLLKNILKSYGYYFVQLETNILANDNNSIDLVYNFNLGEIAKITKIKFIGNKYFDDRTLEM